MTSKDRSAWLHCFKCHTEHRNMRLFCYALYRPKIIRQLSTLRVPIPNHHWRPIAFRRHRMFSYRLPAPFHEVYVAGHTVEVPPMPASTLPNFAVGLQSVDYPNLVERAGLMVNGPTASLRDTLSTYPSSWVWEGLLVYPLAGFYNSNRDTLRLLLWPASMSVSTPSPPASPMPPSPPSSFGRIVS